jgi:hypothetical protein
MEGKGMNKPLHVRWKRGRGMGSVIINDKELVWDVHISMADFACMVLREIIRASRDKI